MKITGSLNKLVFNKNNKNRPASSKNNNIRPISGKNYGNNNIRFGSDGIEHVKKLEKSKDQKLAKFQKLFKSKKLKNKKLLKNRNLSNFDAMKVGPSFLNPNTKTAFNRL